MPARFYLPPDKWDARTLEGEEAKHAIKVLRLKENAEIELFNGNGLLALGLITTITGKSLTFKIINEEFIPRSSPVIHLYQAVPKGKNMDLIIQKAVELGVSIIQPIISKNTVAISDQPLRKTEKWQKIALEACKQCKQPYLPSISPPTLFTDLQETTGEVKLVGALTADAQPMRSILECHPKVTSIGIAVGPEGDFTQEELQALVNKGFSPVTLGDLTLRVETATLYMISATRYQYT